MTEFNVCQAKHQKHELIVCETILGTMTIYDYEQYMGFPGYCTGQDDISRSLSMYGVWGAHETNEIRDVLKSGNRDHTVIDIGSHIGYFARMANQLGYNVELYEGDRENLLVSTENTESEKCSYQAFWFSEQSVELQLKTPTDIELVKIDVEGSERHAIRVLDPYLKRGKIKHIYMEVSPVFNGYYPALVNRIKDYGYSAYLDGKPFDDKYEFAQENILFVRQAV